MAACRSAFFDDDVAPPAGAPRFEVLAAAREAGVVTPFRAWRGRSGRRYVVSVYRPETLPAQDGAVLIAVRRDANGSRRILAVGIDAVASSADADEIHVHLLAGTTAAREAVVADLVG